MSDKQIDYTSTPYLVKRICLNYIKPHLFTFLFAISLMFVIAGTTAAHAYLIKPALDSVFVDKNTTMLVIIPLAIITISLIVISSAVFVIRLQYLTKIQYDHIILDISKDDPRGIYLNGWGVFETDGNNNSWAWTEAKSAGLDIDLSPEHDYRMLFEVYNHKNNKNQKIIVNMDNIKIAEYPIKANDSGRFEVFLSKRLFKQGTAKINFNFNQNNYPDKLTKRNLAVSFGKIEFIKIE